MSNLAIKIEDYDIESKAVSYFKEIFIKFSIKKKTIELDIIFQIVYEDLGISKLNSETKDILTNWFENITQLKYLKDIVAERVEEVVIHNPNHVLAFYSNEVKSKCLSISAKDIELSMQVLTTKKGLAWNYNNPFISFHSHINNYSVRMTLIHSSIEGEKGCPKVFIRIIGNQPLELNLFTGNENVDSILKNLIINKENVLITGSTGSGKTTFLNSLLNKIKDEHVVVLEDTKEISIKDPNFTYMLSNSHPEYTLKKYCEYVLRMRPDRIILGEMRGEEVIPFILSMNNGHRGLMSTIHANCASDGLNRVALLFELKVQNKSIDYSTILKMVARNINYVVHLDKKKVTEIIKVFGSDGERVTFEYIYSLNKNACKEYNAT